MTRFRDISVPHKLMAVIMFTSGMALLASTIATFIFSAIDFRRTIEDELTSTSQILGSSVGVPLAFRDAKAAKDSLASFKPQRHIVAACIYSAQEELFASYLRDASASCPGRILARGTYFQESRFVVYQVIEVGGEKVGTIYVAADLSKFWSSVRRSGTASVITFVICVIVGLLLASICQKVISDPILQLSHATAWISKHKDYSNRIPVHRKDEIGALIESFNEMVEEIQRRDEELQLHREHLEEKIATRTSELQGIANRLQAILEHAPVGIVTETTDGHFEETNTAFQRMTGCSATELKQINTLDLTHREDIEDTLTIMARLRSGEVDTFDLEKRYVLNDGRSIRVRAVGARLDPTHVISIVEDITERRRTQSELARLARIVEFAEDAIISIGLDQTILSWNRGAERLFGYSEAQILGRREEILLAADPSTEQEQVRKVIDTGRAVEIQTALRITKLGQEKPVSLTISPVKDEFGNVVAVSKICRDLTQIVRAQELEEQLRQSQKLEAVGRLAGGIAHDFNNLLMVISSYGELLEDALPIDGRSRKYTREIRKATERAASLTQQMLAFSRKQVLAPRVIDLNAIIAETAQMITRVIGEDIQLKFRPDTPLSQIEADPGQISQILMNLCVNARDAMPNGGKITISTSNAIVDISMSSIHANVHPGRYVLLTVEDDGEGMTREIQEHIFEPFFTTKELGKGTGLGLATVYGIVKQSGGYIWVYSEPGEGSCFKLYFPSTDKRSSEVAPGVDHSGGRGETILVAEDEEALRTAVCEHLQHSGYVVLAAANGDDALKIAKEHQGPIHVLLTDVIMPNMNGPELSEKLRNLPNRRNVSPIFMSGYTDDRVLQHGLLRNDLTLIQKPFSLARLGEKLRAILQA